MATKFTVRLIIEGIAAVVPSEKIVFGSPKNLSHIDVYFLRAERPFDFGKSVDKGGIRHPHFLWGEVDNAEFVSDSEKPDLLYRSSPGQSERAVFLRKGVGTYELELTSVPSPRLLEVNQVKPTNTTEPTTLTTAERRSLFWLLRPGDLSSEVQHARFKEIAENIQAHLRISGGNVFVNGFSNGGSPWPMKGYYAPGSGTPPVDLAKRAIGNQLAVELEVSKFELNTTRNGAAYSTIGIQAPDRDGEVVTLFLRNVEAESLLGIEQEPLGPDEDFGEFYRNSKGEMTFPWVLPLADAQVGSERKPCAPALFEE